MISNLRDFTSEGYAGYILGQQRNGDSAAVSHVQRNGDFLLTTDAKDIRRMEGMAIAMME